MTVALSASITRQPSRLLLAIGVLSIGLVVGGVVMARTMNLAACPLCILQRMVYLLISIEVMLSVIILRSYRSVYVASIVVALSSSIGVWIAAYQTWLQRFATVVSCTANQPWWESFVYWAGAQVPQLFEATGLCSEAGWKFLSLSIAEWSLLMFSAMTFAAVRAAWLCRR